MPDFAILHKPVDLVMLNTDEHVLTNPAVRMASQGGSVDWFRFWLKDERIPTPPKLTSTPAGASLREITGQKQPRLSCLKLAESDLR